MTSNVPKALVGLYHMSSFQNIYRGFLLSKPKERFETILEPLQAMTTLACLSECPVGSKITIQSNLLFIQHPSWSQGIMRAYNHDNKDDLFFLYSVISRFISFYKNLHPTRGEIALHLYEQVRTMAIKGIDRLIQTYSYTEKHSLLHTMNMYRSMLMAASSEVEATDWGIAPKLDLEELDKVNEGAGSSRRTSRSNSLEEGSVNESLHGGSDTPHENLDAVFIKIVDLYSDDDLRILYHSLRLLSKNSSEHESYISGLEKVMQSTNNNIRKWINENIVF